MQNWLASTGKAFWIKFFTLALPVSLQSMMFATLAMFDAIMVATLGNAEVAAVGLGGQVFFLNLLTILGIASTVNILGAQYYAVKNTIAIRSVLIKSIAWCLLINIPFAFLYLFNPGFFVSIASEDTQLIELASTYLQITGWTILITSIVIPLENILRTMTDVMVPTAIGFITILINLLFNYILIFGAGPIEAMGVAGAAWATVIGRLSQLVMISAFIYFYRASLIPSIDEIKNSLQKNPMLKFFIFIWPILIKHMGWALGVLCYSLIITAMGTEALAIYALIAPIEGIIGAGFMGFSTACGILLGHELGVNNFKRAWYQSWTALYAAVLMATLIGIIVYFSQYIIRDFLYTTDLKNIDLIINVILVMSLGLGIKVHNAIAINGILKSGGDIKYSAFIDIFGLWVFGIPAVLFAALYLKLPLHWVLFFMLAEEVAKFILSFLRMTKKKWLNNLIDKETW